MKIRFHVSLAIGLVLVIVAFTLVTLFNIQMLTGQTGRDSANQTFRLAAGSIETEIGHLIDETLDRATLVSGLQFPEAIIDLGLDSRAGYLMLRILEQDAALYSAYLAFDDDRFYQIIAIREDADVENALGAPAGSTWALRVIRPDDDSDIDGALVEEWRFIDRELRLLDLRVEESPEYRPTGRPWYAAAKPGDKALLSEAYIFNSNQKPGISASRRLEHGPGVAGIDLTLDTLDSFLSDLPLSDNGQALILDQKNRLIAHAPKVSGVAGLGNPDGIMHPAMALLTASQDKNAAQASDEGMFVYASDIALPGAILKIGMTAPETDFLGPFVVLQERVLLACAAGILLFLPLVVFYSKAMARRLQHVVNYAERMQRLDFSPGTAEPFHIQEFDALARSVDVMREHIGDHSRQLEESRGKLGRLVELGIAMASERDSDKVMDLLLKGAKEIANADGGTLYLIKDDALEFQILLNSSLDIERGALTGEKPELPAVPLYDGSGDYNRSNVVSQAVHAGTTIHIEDVYQNDEFNFTGTRHFDELYGYRSKSFLTVPLRPRGGNIIGAIQILNAQNAAGEIIGFNPEIQRFIEALAAQAATILHNRDLMAAQEALLDSLIQLMANAIDTKSPYTGGHCERVPELSLMLAKAAEECSEGPLADFAFESDDDRRAFTIGAWLHDCGKVVTPEFVVDKATKLETIYNRIHEVRTRFEVLLRDAEITFLKGLLQGDDEAVLQAAFDATRQQLQDDFALVAESNIGSENMPEDNIRQLERIASQTWLRHFDDTLGLSHEEQMYRAKTPSLPAKEALLVDKPWHIVPRFRDVAAQYEALGFNLTVPAFLYNRGEMHNLTVRRGTLNPEERFQIQEHITQTIAMLEALPLPDHLGRIPEYAGTHHETLDGTGYPRGLEAADLSVPARIVAVADVFEALTAADRPYKTAKTLTEAITLLHKRKIDGHLDPDIFDLFLTSGVYMDYAQKYLREEQIDDVEIAPFLG